MQEVYLYARTSHRYVDGWRHLDSDKFVGSILVTPRKMVAAGEGFEEGGTYLQHARIPAGMPVRLFKQAVRDTLGGSNCKHEHDCCGCASYHVSVQNRGRKAVIRTRVSYNF